MDSARLLERIERARCEPSFRKNCISAALFISGVRDIEVGVEPWDAHKFVGNLHSGYPQPGSILAFRSRISSKPERPHFSHMAVVIDTNPMKLVHRDSYHAPLTFVEGTVEIANLQADYSHCDAVYLNPPA